mmetsp:Transcript_3672/g.5582  ORF Transcript_3672/g.5582 Transcript_3672/m.5582 type:complete len:277 (+) Transcript_3672:396-1226(+)
MPRMSRLMQALRIVGPVSPFDDGKTFNDFPNSHSFEWTNREDDPDNRTRYMELIKAKTTEAFRKAELTGSVKTEILDNSLKRVSVPLSDVPKVMLGGASDVLIILKTYFLNPTQGALVGIEMKKGLKDTDIAQIIAYWIMYSWMSRYPFLQLLTDLNGGGVALYRGIGPPEATIQEGMEPPEIVLHCRFLSGMEDFWSFFGTMMVELERSLSVYDCAAAPSLKQLDSPLRFKYDRPEGKSNIQLEQFHLDDLIACISRSDVACLEDLEGFPELESE